MTTDYRFRGISQNDEDFAIQGGFDYAHDSGFYAGLWASNVDFQIQTVDDASAELDIYAGSTLAYWVTPTQTLIVRWITILPKFTAV